MCLNDVTLIQMHNDILDGGVQGNLISSTNGQAYRTEKEKITEESMPRGKGTYGSKVGRPPKKKSTKKSKKK